MPTQIKIFLLLALVVLVISIFVVSSSLITNADDDNYLTPIPESTWSAYHRNEINSKLDAVLTANQEIHSWRMVFTEGEPKVVYVEKMKFDAARKLLNIQYERPGNIKVWLVIFEGQWQILPPMVDELGPVETGCINVIIPANGNDPVGYLGAGTCVPLP